MTYEHDYLLFIGRLQCPHFGHFKVIQTALEYGEKLIIGLGSANRPRSIRNPFTYEERIAMLGNCGIPEIVSAIESGRILFIPVNDYMYNDNIWVADIKRSVRDITGAAKVALIGHKKDASSYYLDLFPCWPSIDVPSDGTYNSTDIRNMLVHFGHGAYRNTAIGALTTYEVNMMLNHFTEQQWFKDIQTEASYINDYKYQWTKAPYPVKHVTVDAVVSWHGKVLLVKRGGYPGKGLWALPGGHLNEYEEIEDGIVRELLEETNLEMSSKDLKSALIQPTVFADPGRSQLGRVITHAAFIELDYWFGDEPNVKAADDAVEAKWVDGKDLKANQMHDDHFWIIKYFLGSEFTGE